MQTQTHIALGDYQMSQAELQAVMDVCSSERLSPGPYVHEFEDSFSNRHGCEYGIMTNSGTDALRIALATLKEAHGWKDGDIVFVPAVTFVATVNVILQLGLKPVLVDVGMYDYNFNWYQLKKMLWENGNRKMPEAKGLIVVHLCGQPAEMDRIMELAKKADLKVIEDSCETMGVNYGERPVGSWGDIACFSFYMAHLMTTGVGGMAITNNPQYESLMRSYANHGRDPYYIPGRNNPQLSKDLLKARFRFDRLGYSCRPTEFEAAIGMAQLEKLDDVIKRRQYNARKLIGRLVKHDLVLPHIQPNREHAFMMFPIVLPEDSKIDKFDLCLHLERLGIETRELLPLINQPCYAETFNTTVGYDVAKWINKNGFYIASHQYLKASDIEYIGQAFDSFFESSVGTT